MLNYEDVYRCLEEGHVAAVGIDVFHTEPFPQDDKFLNHPKVIATPHIAGVTEVSYRNMAEIVAHNIVLLNQNEKPLGIVNDI